MISTRLNAKKHRTGEAGFSVAEAIVSAGVLTVSSVALISVFTSSVESVKSISSRDAISTAINADLAKTQKLNDNYTCLTGSKDDPHAYDDDDDDDDGAAVASLGPCVANRGLLPPDKYHYAPSNSPEDLEAYSAFAALCKNTPTNLSQAIVNKLGARTTITPNITRTARLHPNNGSTGHLYIVEWDPPEGAKTQIILSPTVSQWCP
jgi:hypothetical protein